ncbi:MAG: hypothetical protein IPJ69_04730 [Deltaproteobacteria bacterium]|nr:MAG: hypothetical protein IPJ69_04730 [Deltaproteobacteria bacterium]
MKKVYFTFALILMLSLHLNAFADWGNDRVVSGRNTGSYCDIFSNGVNGLSTAISRYFTPDPRFVTLPHTPYPPNVAADTLFREGCSYGIVLSPYDISTGAGLSRPTNFIAGSSSGITFGVKPSYNAFGTQLRQCDSINTRRCVSNDSTPPTCVSPFRNYEAQYCTNDPTTGRPNPNLIVVDVSNYSGDDDCPIKVVEGALMEIRDVTIRVKPGTDFTKVICKSVPNVMGGYDAVPRNVLLTGDTGTVAPTGVTRPSAAQPNRLAYIYNIIITDQPANPMPGTGGMSGAGGSGGMGGAGTGGATGLTCKLGAKVNTLGDGWVLAFRTNGRVTSVDSSVKGETANVCIKPEGCGTSQVVNPDVRTCYALTCDNNGQGQVLVSPTRKEGPFCLDPRMGAGSGGDSGSGGNNGTGGSGPNATGGTGGSTPSLSCTRGPITSLSGGRYRLSVNVTGASAGTMISCTTRQDRMPGMPASVTPVDGVCTWDVTPTVGVMNYAIEASASGFNTCAEAFRNPLINGMAGTGGNNTGGTGGNGTGGAGGSIGELDCHLDVTRTATGYRLSWTRANTSGVQLTMNSSPVSLTDAQTFLDVAQSDITARREYSLTLRPATGVTACTAAIEPVVLAPAPVCEFPERLTTRNANGSYAVHWTAANAGSIRLEGPGYDSSNNTFGPSTTGGDITTPVITQRVSYTMTVTGAGASPAVHVCMITLDPAGNDNGVETPPLCRIDPPVLSGGSYQVTYNVGTDATVTQLFVGTTATIDTVTPENLDFTAQTATNGVKRLTRTEQVSAPRIYRLVARKRVGGPVCRYEVTLLPTSGDESNPDPDRDGVCNLVVTPRPAESVCTYRPNDGVDNCPLVYNPDQTDDNFDGVGDVCLNPDISPLETAYAEGGASLFSCEMAKTSSGKPLESLIPFLVILIGFGFFKIGFGKKFFKKNIGKM